MSMVGDRPADFLTNWLHCIFFPSQEVVSLCVGEPDFQPPPAVLKATVEASERGITKYTEVTGMVSLREGICTDLRIRKKLGYEPNQVVVGNGAKQAIYESVLAIVKPGDEVRQLSNLALTISPCR